LKQAIELDPRNHLAHYYQAYILDRASSTVFDDLDAKRNSLGKAIELVPEYVPAYELLAYLNLTADIDYNGTLDLLRKANSYAPGNQNVRFLMAQVLVKKQEYDQAEKILQVVLNGTGEASLREGARNLSNYISRLRAGENREQEEAMARARKEDEQAREAARQRAAAQQAAPPEPVVAAAPPPSPASAPAANAPRNGELVLVTPQKARPEGSTVTGSLTLVDCRNGLTLTIRSGNETLRLHSDTPDKIEFVSYVPTVSASISCGVVPGTGIPVVVTYRPTPGAATAGEPLMVEFVEK
jgi:tetratricopeptide (TPR) repeat protein